MKLERLARRSRERKDKMLINVLPMLAFVSCLELCLPAQTVSFLAHRDIPIGSGCCAIVSGDFNGDGKLDLVVGYGSGSLALLLGDGAGGFKQKMELTVFADAIVDLKAADLNRDGKVDLLVGTSGSVFQTYSLLGRGDGSFQSPRLVASGWRPLFVADLNSDKIPDLGVWAGCLQVQLGNGDGTFQNPLACGPQPEGLGINTAVGDFNGDGKPDFVESSDRNNGGVWLFLGNGDGTFRYSYATGLGIRPNGARKSLAVGDLNKDGKLDLVVGGVDHLTVFLGNGDGTFQSFEIPLDLSPANGADPDRDLFVADLNGDGNLDITNDNVLVLGNGDGTFQPPQYLLTASTRATSQVCADLNGDGLPDLIYVDYEGNPFLQNATTLSVLLNNSPGLLNSGVGHSAATGVGPVAPSSIGSVFGKNLARATATAPGGALPTQLGGISLRIRDSTDTVRLAPLFYVSPTQINFLVPDQTPLGPVTLTIDDGSNPPVETANATAVTVIAPTIFTANGRGQGVAAATAVRILPDGSEQPLTVFNCTSPGQCTTVPIDLAGGRPVYLSLYGTGFRAISTLMLGNAACQVGGANAVIQFLGAQPAIPGLDQINLLVPASLQSGVVSVQCQSPIPLGPTTNLVQIAIK